MHCLAQGENAQQDEHRRTNGQQRQSGLVVADLHGGHWVKHREHDQYRRQEGEDPPSLTRRIAFQLFFFHLRRLTPIGIFRVHDGRLRVFLHFVGIPQHENDAHHGQDGPADGTVADAREQRDARDALRDADGERIKHGA